jgi:hypothetical protein
MYDEMDINEQRSYDQYNDVRDVISQVSTAEIPLSMNGLASAIADSLSVSELENLVSALDLLQAQRQRVELEKAGRDDYFKVKHLAI